MSLEGGVMVSASKGLRKAIEGMSASLSWSTRATEAYVIVQDVAAKGGFTLCYSCWHFSVESAR